VLLATKHLPALEGDALHLEGVEGSGKREEEVNRGVGGASVGDRSHAGCNISMQAIKTQ
jgi:hypothetical protein